MQRPIPKDLQHQGLPRRYSTQSAAGRYVLTAAIQHSLWMAMAEVVFESYGMQIGQGMVRVADALYRKDPAKEAVWRLLAINTILEDGELLKILRSHLNAVADRLLESWELFQEGQQRDEFRTGLSALLYDCSTAWLTLLKLRKRLFVSLQWNERRFETDSGEDAAHVPGDFAQQGAINPILFLCPAFLENNTDDISGLPKLIQKGKVLLKNSPHLLTALKEEQEISSPRVAHRAVFSQNVKESLN